MKLLITFAAVLALSLPAQAHRLDEYLQATRVAVSMNRIDLAIDLTPGVAIAGELLPSIDPNGNDRIPPHQGDEYARRILKDLRLELDGKRQRIKLIRASFPTRGEMEAGEGTIHLEASAQIQTLQPKAHEILFRNNHLPKISVYLVNALVPANQAIQITHQVRDERQTEYHLSFEVKPALMP